MAVSRINEAGLNVNQFGNRNVVINGAMNVAQRATSATGLGASDGYFTVDRYKLFFGGSTAGRLTMTQDSSAPNGFANSMKLDCTTADTTVASGEYLFIRQSIEGQDLQRFAKGTSDAKEFTVSFYVKGNASATYVVELEDTDNDRVCSKTFNVTTNWTRVILTFPADTTGAFADDNGGSLNINIWLHAGSTFSSGTLNSSSFAARTNANRAVGISSFFDSTDRTFFLTGVQLEVGDTATDFEHRTFGDELARCQRYFQRYEIASGGMKVAVQASTQDGYGSLDYSPKRADPTITLPTSAVATGANTISLLTSAGSYRSSAGTAVADKISKETCRLKLTGFTASGAIGDACWIYFATNTSTDPHILLDAEL